MLCLTAVLGHVFETVDKTEVLRVQKGYLRHRNDHKIEPVPWVSKECEVVYTETSGNDFYK